MIGATPISVWDQSESLQAVADVEWGRHNKQLFSRHTRTYEQQRQGGIEPFENFWQTRSDPVEDFNRETPCYQHLARRGVRSEVAIESFRREPGFMASLKVAKTRLEAGFAVIYPDTRHVLAWVGGRDLT